MAAEDLRVSQIRIRREFVRMKRVNGRKLCLRAPFAHAISQKKRNLTNMTYDDAIEYAAVKF